MSLKIGITGHRHLLQPGKVRQEIKTAIEKIVSEKSATQFEGYSALAIGADTIFAEVVLELGGTLQAVLPFAKGKYKKDFNEKDQKVLKNLLSRSSTLKKMRAGRVSVPERRNKAYLDCGKKIADDCDVLVVVWDGKDANGVGGTGDIIKYARSLNKETVIIAAVKDDLQKIKYLRDKTAVDFQKKFEWQWIQCILLGISAAALLATGITFKEELSPEARAILGTIEFVFVLWAAANIYHLEKGYLKSNRIQNRREAERLRVIEQLSRAKLKMKDLDNREFISDAVRKLEEQYILQKHTHIDLEISKEKLQELIDEQVNYHEDYRYKKNYHPLHNLEAIQRFLLIAFIVFVAIHIYTNWIEVLIHKADCPVHLPYWIGLFFSLMIPPVYAGIEGYIYFKEFKRNLNDSKIMLSFFNLQKKQLGAIDLHSATAQKELTDMANTIRNKMDEENINWAYTTDIKTAPGP